MRKTGLAIDDLGEALAEVPALKRVTALERRQQQLAKLTQAKEDLERELAKMSEPFRRTRDAGRTSVADMVRRLPAKTAVVDFVERWQWTPPGISVALPLGSIGKGGKQRDALPVGSFWKGEKLHWKGEKLIGKAKPATLRITERDGSSFKGEFTFDQLGQDPRLGDPHNVDEVAGPASAGYRRPCSGPGAAGRRRRRVAIPRR
jgi:hypothetical protein